MLEYGLAFAGVKVDLRKIKITDSTCDWILPSTYILRPKLFPFTSAT